MSIKRMFPNTRTFRFRNSRFHSENDFPAIDSNNIKIWCKNGQLHRSKGPTIEYDCGEGKVQIYTKNGMLHRENGPAVIIPKHKIEAYYVDNMLHNINKPTITSVGTFYYYKGFCNSIEFSTLKSGESKNDITSNVAITNNMKYIINKIYVDNLDSDIKQTIIDEYVYPYLDNYKDCLNIEKILFQKPTYI